jgi:thiamine biosynthesis lipoprotein
VLVPRQAGAGALSDAASKPIFIEGAERWEDAAARMGISSAMLVDFEGIVHITNDLNARLRLLH